MEEQINRSDFIYESNKYKYDFRNITTTRSFGEGRPRSETEKDK